MNLNILSWNVNGIRSNLKKGILPLLLDNPGQIDKNIKELSIIALQETKADFKELGKDFYFEGYNTYHNSATERKGYSGTVIYVKKELFSKEIDLLSIDKVSFETLLTEGRVVSVELKDFILINCYFPNGGGKPERLEYKLKFYDEFALLCKKLNETIKKPIIFCGDLNIAHKEIDLARPKQNENNVGFLKIERDKLDILQKNGYVDIYRHLNPEKQEYSWWDMKTRSRDRDIGWRIDAFYVQNSFIRNILEASIHGQVLGSDHCPVLLKISV